MTMFAKSGKSAAANTRLAMLNVRRELSTRVEFAAEINRLVGQGLETMVEAGRRLTEAKAALPHGEFEAMLREDLDLDPSAAYRLRFVAEFVESGAVPKEDLPGHYSKIFILATLTPEQLGAARSRDLVSPKAAKRQLEAFKSGCEGKGVPAIEDAGIGLLIAAPSAEAAPAAPDARAPDPEEPLPPIMVAESIPLAPADSASLFAKLDEQKDRLTDASAMSPSYGVLALMDVPDLLLIRLDGMLLTRGLACPNTITLRLPDSEDHLTLHRRDGAYEISAHFPNPCTNVGSTMSKTKVADFPRAWFRADIEAEPVTARETVGEPPAGHGGPPPADDRRRGRCRPRRRGHSGKGRRSHRARSYAGHRRAAPPCRAGARRDPGL
ncbi:DUF3102 family protein [Azospirillum baldaniorum]|uniref:DUF3102 domain-containing protein n=1 Tax=Azospirillum baldaniorum TaxID=1064539 RepID=UPI0011A2BDB3|nr:DUF3102 domain-containing protein [Azospirillum baldaniorum]TWA69711.1 DUF3102 family protein [Azospirillum baldaniorum]